jgi:SAM-dependent methyltransferase
MAPDRWDDGSAYDRYMGRWSSAVAAVFVDWLEVPNGAAWLDVGCGTGRLSQTLLARAAPRLVIGCDRSPAYVAFAAAGGADARLTYVVAESPHLPTVPGGFDAVVSGLVLNFLPEPVESLRAMAARAHPRGVVAAYVWDYADGMRPLRVFWDAATELDPGARERDEGVTFPDCSRERLQDLWVRGGLRDVSVRALDITAVFADFDDYWRRSSAARGRLPATWPACRRSAASGCASWCARVSTSGPTAPCVSAPERGPWRALLPDQRLGRRGMPGVRGPGLRISPSRRAHMRPSIVSPRGARPGGARWREPAARSGRGRMRGGA